MGFFCCIFYFFIYIFFTFVLKAQLSCLLVSTFSFLNCKDLCFLTYLYLSFFLKIRTENVLSLLFNQIEYILDTISGIMKDQVPF